MSRIAPEGGYNFGAKQKFREFVWSAIASRSPWREPGQHVLLMPSSEGTEIDVALGRGFREDALHVVDQNAAIVATLKRKYPRLQTYGVSIERAHGRVARKGVRLYGASIDLCAHSGWSTVRQLAICSETDAWQNGARIVVNVLRGREDFTTTQSQLLDKRILKNGWFSKVQLLSPDLYLSDLWRVWRIAYGMPNHVAVPTRIMTYASTNGQTFLTSVFRVHRVCDITKANSYNSTQRPAMGRPRFVRDAKTADLLTSEHDLVCRSPILHEDAFSIIPAWARVNACSRSARLWGHRLPAEVQKAISEYDAAVAQISNPSERRRYSSRT